MSESATYANQMQLAHIAEKDVFTRQVCVDFPNWPSILSRLRRRQFNRSLKVWATFIDGGCLCVGAFYEDCEAKDRQQANKKRRVDRHVVRARNRVDVVAHCLKSKASDWTHIFLGMTLLLRPLLYCRCRRCRHTRAYRSKLNTGGIAARLCARCNGNLLVAAAVRTIINERWLRARNFHASTNAHSSAATILFGDRLVLWRRPREQFYWHEMTTKKKKSARASSCVILSSPFRNLN